MVPPQPGLLAQIYCVGDDGKPCLDPRFSTFVPPTVHALYPRGPDEILGIPTSRSIGDSKPKRDMTTLNLQVVDFEEDVAKTILSLASTTTSTTGPLINCHPRKRRKHKIFSYKLLVRRSQ
jgi:hypothetical protein